MRSLAAIVLVSLLTACSATGLTGGSSAEPSVTPLASAAKPIRGVNFTYVRPSVYTKGITPKYDAENVIAYPQRSAVKNKLFVWLPGTKAVPKQYRYVLAEAALNGFNAIGLEYPNGTEVNALCASSTDPNCWGGVRFEILTGIDSTPLVNVNAANSIEQRLIDLLGYLAKRYPKQNWGAFLSNGQPKWSWIEVGGHSQGAGQAGFIAKESSVAGACMIESPVDANAYIPAAAWLSESPLTSTATQYGFGNELDSFADFARMTLDWSLMGLSGPLVDVDQSSPPYFQTHQLFTSKGFRIPLNSHDYPVMDYITPIGSNGVPTFAPVWIYACALGTNLRSSLES
jgi:hypothetical protein